MSRETETEPHSPRPKSSTSSIYETLKSLTSNKNRRSTPTTTTANTESPNDATSGDSASLQSVRKTLKRVQTEPLKNGTRHVSSVEQLASHAEFIGGPNSVQKAVSHLRSVNSMSIRIAAAKQLATLLARYPIEDVDTIWSIARDITDHPDVPGAIDAAYGLLLSCVEHKTLVARERITFLETLTNDHRLESLTFRLRILEALTYGGRYLDHLETFITPLIVGLLGQSFEAAVSARKRNKAAKDARYADEKPLAHIFQFIQALFKFNATVLAESDLTVVIQNVLAICKRTTSSTDVSRAVDIIDAVMTYSLLPSVSLRPCLEVLCGTFYKLKILKNQSLASIRKLLNSHLEPFAMEAMYSIIKDDPPSEDKMRYTIRGAISVLRDMLISSEDINKTRSLLSNLLSALKVCPLLESATPGTDRVEFQLTTMQLLFEILRPEHKFLSLLDHMDWASLSVILIKCSRTQEVMRRRQLPNPKRVELAPATQDLDVEASELAQCSLFLQKLITGLLLLCNNEDFEHKSIVMDTFMQFTSPLDDAAANSLIKYQIDEQKLLPPLEQWLQNCQQMHRVLFKDRERSAEVRLSCLLALRNAFNTALALNTPHASDLVTEILDGLPQEKDASVVRALCALAVDVGSWTENRKLYNSFLDTLLSSLPEIQTDELATSLERPLSSDSPRLREPLAGSESYDKDIVKVVAGSFVSLFLRSVRISTWKCQRLYNVLLRLAGSTKQTPEARVVVLKLLARLRGDVSYAIFVIPDPCCQTLAETLSRTSGTLQNHFRSPDSPMVRPTRPEEHVPRRKNQSAPASAAPHEHRVGNSVRSVGAIQRPAPVKPSWFYGGVSGLPEPAPTSASPVLFSHIELASGEANTQEKLSDNILDTSRWLDLVIALLQQTQEQMEWEVYSYIIVHVGAQLTNYSLFVDAIPQVRLLRSVLCTQLARGTFLEPPSWTNLKKGDVPICLYDILTMLISYGEHFERAEEDEMVRVFINGIGAWEKSSEFCIHALSISSLEFPNSVMRALDSALQKMTQIITQAHIAVHVLEYLAGLARMPELFSNFREPEYKTVFAICFRYLQYVRDQRKKPLPSNSIRNSKGPSVAVQVQFPQSLADELPQYVYVLAYHVMTFFFMSLRLKDRPRYMAWIANNLRYRDDSGTQVLEEQSEVTLDYMHRIAYSDREAHAARTVFSKAADGIVVRKSWLIGMSIMTVEIARRTGLSRVTHRGPSGVKWSIIEPSFGDHSEHQVHNPYGPDADFFSNNYVGVTPDEILAQFYDPITMLSQSPRLAIPIPLPDDEATQRNIAALDRISAVDGHKVGIIYVGEGQTDETTILANVMGSEDYTTFLTGIGELTRLKNANFNPQGLDREYDTDGKFTFRWRNQVTELVFHVTTMMPTNLDNDPHCANKKRHTGNDFVNIIFNNSGIPFDTNTFPSDFNYVNIEIVPQDRTSFIETRLRAADLRRGNHTFTPTSQSTTPLSTPGLETGSQSSPFVTCHDLFYKVTVHTKDGLPNISPAAETKVVSAKSLPTFVRLLALNASVFALVWANREIGEPVSSWRSRLKEIARLRERHPPPPPPDFDAPVAGDGDMETDKEKETEAQLASPLLSAAPFSPANTTAVGLPLSPQMELAPARMRDSGVSGVGGGAGVGNAALGLLRRMSLATVAPEGAGTGAANGVGAGAGGGSSGGATGSAQRGSLSATASGTERSSSVGSRASREQ